MKTFLKKKIIFFLETFEFKNLLQYKNFVVSLSNKKIE